ncbi:MAG: hypothetical protein ACRDJL_04325 [Actinomycetota bacterium]
MTSEAAQITFQTYEPAEVFPGYEPETVRPVVTQYSQIVDFTYSRGDDRVYAFQSPLAERVDASDTLRPVAPEDMDYFGG